MRMDPLREHMVDDRFGSRPDDQRLFKFLAAAVSNHSDFRREALNMLGLFLQKTLRNKQRKVGIAGAGLLDSAIQLVTQVLPDSEAIRTKYDTSAHRRVVGQFGADNQVIIPSSKILAPRRDFLLVIFLGHKQILSGNVCD